MSYAGIVISLTFVSFSSSLESFLQGFFANLYPWNFATVLRPVCASVRRRESFWPAPLEHARTVDLPLAFGYPLAYLEANRREVIRVKSLVTPFASSIRENRNHKMRRDLDRGWRYLLEPIVRNYFLLVDVFTIGYDNASSG